MQINKADLSARFGYLWRRILATDTVLPEIFEGIWRAYHEPHRGYHNMLHIEESLAVLDEAKLKLGMDEQRYDALELAIWFHDIVYYTQVQTCGGEPGISNEELSAAWARGVLVAAQARDYFPRVVYRLIASTHIEREPADDLEAVMHDIDYAIIGAPLKRFLTYEDGIRREWNRIPDEKYVPARRAFLQRLASAERIYRTDHFKIKYVTRARENLRALLDEMKGEGA